MTSRRLTLFIVGAAILMAATLPRAAGPVEIVVWHGYRGDEKTAFEKVVAAYNASRASRGIKATTLAVPYDAYPDKISATVPRGKGPDVFIYAQDRLGGWIEAGNTIEPIGFYLDAKTKARFLPATLEAMTYRGEIYGLPLNYKVITMIYNRKLVPRPPATSGELVKVATKLTEASTGRFGLAYWYAELLLSRAADERIRRRRLRHEPQAAAELRREHPVAQPADEVGRQGPLPACRVVYRARHLSLQRGEGGELVLACRPLLRCSRTPMRKPGPRPMPGRDSTWIDPCPHDKRCTPRIAPPWRDPRQGGLSACAYPVVSTRHY